MTGNALHAHVLAVDVMGSGETVGRSLAILSDLVATSDAYRQAQGSGRLALVPARSGLTVIFFGETSAPMNCAVELWETLRELPSMSVVMGIASGSVDLVEVNAGATWAGGEGIDTARALASGGKSGQIMLSPSYARTLADEGVSAAPLFGQPAESSRPQKIFLINSSPSATGVAGGLRARLAASLVSDGHEVTDEQTSGSSPAWAQSLENRIRGADTVIAVTSGDEPASELALYELEIAADERSKRGKPQILPVWVMASADEEAIEVATQAPAVLSQNLHHAAWFGAEDNQRVVSEVREALAAGQVEIEPGRLDSFGGAVPLESRFYVERPADRQLQHALREHESIVLIKGPRQVGKTSLIGRAMHFVDEQGWRCATTDFQKLGSRQLEEEEAFYRVLMASLSLDLDFPFDSAKHLNSDLGPKMSMGRFVKGLVAGSDKPLVWFIDEADRLFTSSFASDFFGLVRSWHNARATDLRGPWSRLTIVIGYATEAHLFIDNLNQSPFNVGHPVPLSMFTLPDTHDLNTRYGNPFKSPSDVEALHTLVGGQPFLTRRAFDVLVRGEVSVELMFTNAAREDGPFGDHLKRILVSVTQLPYVWEALRGSMTNAGLPNSKGIQRLVAAGILVQNGQGFGLACELYRRFLARHLSGNAVVQGGVAPAAPSFPEPPMDSPEASVNERLVRELVRLRKKRKLGQTSIAAAIGLSQARISQIENMKGGVPMDTLWTYARAVGANLVVGPDQEIRIGTDPLS